MYICRLNIRLSLVWLILLSAVSVWGQSNEEKAVRALENAGFVNIRVAENDSLFVVTFGNEAYKLQASGIAAAVRILDDEGVLEGKRVKMIATDNGVPKVTLTYDPVLGDWKTTYKLDESWKMVRRARKHNGTLGKVDITVYPQVALKNLIITQVYQSLWQLSPSVDIPLWYGARFSYQLKFTLFNDGFGDTEDGIHPGMVTFSQRFRAPFDIFGKASVGLFSNYRYGANLELFRPFSFNENLSLEGSVGVVGLNYWDKFVLHIDLNSFNTVWSFGANYYWPGAQTQFTLKAQRFLYGDTGVKFEMMRHFRYCTVGFYAEKGFDKAAHANGGFRFQIALPPYRYKRYKYVPRVTTGYIGMTYNANNEQEYYLECKYEAGDNIMEHNGYNPAYIRSEIKKLNDKQY